jgi:hypothetical protein
VFRIVAAYNKVSKVVATADQLVREVSQQRARHHSGERRKEWLDLLFAAHEPRLIPSEISGWWWRVPQDHLLIGEGDQEGGIKSATAELARRQDRYGRSERAAIKRPVRYSAKCRRSGLVANRSWYCARRSCTTVGNSTIAGILLWYTNAWNSA